MGIVGSLNLKGAGRAEAGASACDVDIHVTRYHMAQAEKARRRAKSREDAPKRALARRGALDAAFAAAKAIKDAEERKATLLKLDEKTAAAKRSADRAKSERDMVRRRMRVGFENTVHTDVGGRVRAPFREQGLRSDRLGVAAKLFVRGCYKGKRLRAANEKGFIQRQFRSKVLTLDFAWVEGNREMVSLIRVDLDRLFESFDHLRGLLRELVDAGRLPCMPHLVAGDVAVISTLTADNDVLTRPMLVRPHLWFVLPEAVNAGPKGRESPKRLLDAVYRGLCHILLPLTDPNAKALLVRGNPNLPWWQSECFNNNLSEPVRLRQGPRAGHARQPGAACPHVGGTAVRPVEGGQQRVLHGRGGRGMANLARVAQPARHSLPGGAVRSGRSRVSARGRHADGSRPAARRRPRRTSPRRLCPGQGGRLRSVALGPVQSRLCQGLQQPGQAAPPDGRQGHRKGEAGRRRTCQRRGQGTGARDRVLAGMDAVHAAGSPFNQSEVSRFSGVSRKTVCKHWRFCLRAWVNRCVDKKGGLNPDITEDHSTVQVHAQERTEAPVPDMNPVSDQAETVISPAPNPDPSPVVRTGAVPAWPVYSHGEDGDDSDESDLRLIEDQVRFQESDSWQVEDGDEPDSGTGRPARPPLPAWMKRSSAARPASALSLSNPAPILT